MAFAEHLDIVQPGSVRARQDDHPYPGDVERINWRVAVPTTVMGAGLALGGLVVGDFHASAVSSLMLNAGTVVALLAVVVVVQPRLMRQVKHTVEGAATAAVDRATSELRERVVRLEDLDRAQEEEREARHRDRDAAIERLETEGLSPSAVGELLAAAHDEGLFDARQFRVRTSASPKAHPLYMLPLRAANGVRVMWLDFEPIEDGEIVEPDIGIRLPYKGVATTMWINTEPASEIASALEAALERLNEPLYDFSLAYGLERLAASVRVMRAARAADAGSPDRMHGALRVLINDRWAYTSYGLESVMGDAAFPADFPYVEAGSDGGPRAGPAQWGGCVRGCARPDDEPEVEWDEALTWLTEREALQILAPDEGQPHPFSRFSGRGAPGG